MIEGRDTKEKKQQKQKSTKRKEKENEALNPGPYLNLPYPAPKMAHSHHDISFKIIHPISLTLTSSLRDIFLNFNITLTMKINHVVRSVS